MSIDDFFLVGLGVEIAGAWLVSRGLLQNMLQLATAGGVLARWERPRVPQAVEDFVRGAIGLVALGFGFFLQVLGYFFVLDRSRVDYGLGVALIGVGLAIGSFLIVLLIDAVIRPRWRDRMFVRIAQFDFKDGPARLELPRADFLRLFGTETGRPALDDEDDVTYCARVFGVDADSQR